MEKFLALKKAKEEESRFPFLYSFTSEPRCPHCGKECDVSNNDWWKLYEEGEHEVSCPHCESDFCVNTSVRYSFSTWQQDGA